VGLVFDRDDPPYLYIISDKGKLRDQSVSSAESKGGFGGRVVRDYSDFLHPRAHDALYPIFSIQLRGET